MDNCTPFPEWQLLPVVETIAQGTGTAINRDQAKQNGSECHSQFLGDIFLVQTVCFMVKFDFHSPTAQAVN